MFELPDDDRMLWDPYDDKEDSGLLEDDGSDEAYEAARDARMFGEEVAL